MNEVAAVNSSGTNNLTSVEIAELTGKQHKHVMADAVKMLKALELDSAEFSAQYKDSTGRRLPCFSLPPREVKILITGYDVVRRAKVIDRLEQLGIPPAQFSAGYTDQQGKPRRHAITLRHGFSGYTVAVLYLLHSVARRRLPAVKRMATMPRRVGHQPVNDLQNGIHKNKTRRKARLYWVSGGEGVRLIVVR